MDSNPDSKYDMVSKEQNEEDLIVWDLKTIRHACNTLRKPMKDRGLGHKVDVIEKMVADITRRLS